MKRSPSFLPRPSRLALNAGILSGGVIGFIIQASRNATALEAFLLTGGCCLLGALIFSLADIWWRGRNGTPPHDS